MTRRMQLRFYPVVLNQAKSSFFFPEPFWIQAPTDAAELHFYPDAILLLLRIFLICIFFFYLCLLLYIFKMIPKKSQHVSPPPRLVFPQFFYTFYSAQTLQEEKATRFPRLSALIVPPRPPAPPPFHIQECVPVHLQ